MDIIKLSLAFISFYGLFIGCNQTRQVTSTPESSIVTTGDNSMNALDWQGAYKGILPCADCPGIETVIWLHDDLSFKVNSRYLQKSDEVFSSEGSFSWSDNGSKITLQMNKALMEPVMYTVGENKLFMLDRNSKRITGDLEDRYILNKVGPEITGKYWKLTEINGNPLSPDNELKGEPHLILKQGKVQAFGGCNNLTGSYELNNGQRIVFSKMASTRMACPDMSVEDQLMEILSRVDNYAIQGDQMMLSQGSMAPLARFEAVYLR